MSKNEVKIKAIPRWWKYLPFVGVDLIMTWNPYIYLSHHMYLRWTRNEMTLHDESIIVHEMVHLQRQEKIGTFAYTLKYFFSRKFRLKEELVAIREQMAFLKKHGQTYDFDRKAKQFASAEYFWVTSYERGKLMLEGLWSEV
jgi:hypothetical protein